MRLDLFIADREKITRTKAKQLIESGFVKVGDAVITKPAYEVSETSIVTLTDSFRFSSLGGDKLQKAFDDFNYSVKDKVCADIGASNGGFTDCMLQNGAKRVYAVDVGECAFCDELKNDPRVIVRDKTNARYVTWKDLGEKCDFACIDVSFISLKLILSPVKDLLKPDGEIIALIKPQFEAGHKNLSKKGIVLSSKIHAQVCDDIKAFANSIGLESKNLTTAPIKEGKNREFLIYLYKTIE